MDEGTHSGANTTESNEGTRTMIYKEIAPNFRHGQSCANCEHGCLINADYNILCHCTKYGNVPPGGLCDDWEED